MVIFAQPRATAEQLPSDRDAVKHDCLHGFYQTSRYAIVFTGKELKPRRNTKQDSSESNTNPISCVFEVIYCFCHPSEFLTGKYVHL